MAYTITIEEVLNGITVTPPAANEVTVSTTNYPITISYNAVELPGTPGQGVPTGGTAGQVLTKVNSTDYNTEWTTLTDLVGINNVVEDTTPQLGGNLDLNGYSITYAGAEFSMAGGNIDMFPESTAGSFSLGAGSGTGFTNITSGTGGVSIQSATGALTIPGTANGDIDLQAPGTGNINLVTDTVRVGDGNASATITTSGTGNLILNTNAGTNSGTITIAQGTNGAITLSPNGSGSVTMTGPSIATITATTAGSSALTARNSPSPGASNTIRYPSITIQKNRTDIALASMTNEPAVMAWSVRDSASTTRIFATTRAVYQGTGSNPYFAFDASVDGFSTTVDILNLSSTTSRFGNTNTNYTLTTNGTGNLTLSTNSGTNSGTITINQGANADIAITPNGTGKIVLDNNSWPNADGTANQVLVTNGSGVLSWATVNDLTAGTYLTDVVQDVTPQLGGDLDTQGYKITTSQTNGNIKIDAVGTGKVKLNNIAYPNTDGSAGQVLSTDGSGSLGWADKQDPTIVNDSQPAIQSTGQHWYRPVTGAFYTARNGGWESVNDDGYF